MYKQFLKHFSEFEKRDNNEEYLALYERLPTQLFQLFSEVGGKSFERGMYKVHDVRSSIRWAIKIEGYYSTYQKKVYPFGYDWMGRQFCVSSENNNQLIMFDAATGEFFTLEQDLLGFHNSDLTTDTDVMLSSTLFSDVLKSLKLSAVLFDECIGYNVPLFLGGEDSINNYEKQNLEVYWEIQFQLINQVKNLPPGTPIKSIRIEK